MADLMGGLEVVALRTGNKGRYQHAKMAASFALSCFGIFSFR